MRLFVAIDLPWDLRHRIAALATTGSAASAARLVTWAASTPARLRAKAAVRRLLPIDFCLVAMSDVPFPQGLKPHN